MKQESQESQVKRGRGRLIPASTGLPPALHERVSDFAARDNRTFAQALRHFIEVGVNADPRTSRRSQPRAV